MRISQCQFLSGLSPTLRSQVRGQILREDSIFTLTATFSRVMRVFTGADVSSAPFIEQSVMISGRDRGYGRGRVFGGRGREFIRGGRDSYGGRQSASEKGPHNAGIVNAVITCLRSVGRNLVDLSGHVALLRTIHPFPPLFLDLSQSY